MAILITQFFLNYFLDSLLEDVVIETAALIAHWNVSSKDFVHFKHFLGEVQVSIDALVHGLV